MAIYLNNWGYMKNHWTDKKALNDFIDIVSNKVAKLLNVDASKVRQSIEDDIKKNPLDDTQMLMIRETEITDEVIAKIASLRRLTKKAYVSKL